MGRYYYNSGQNRDFTVRGSANLLNVASSRYGGDWTSVPHTHNHTELFFIVSGQGQFLIQNQVFPVDVNNLVIINPNVLHTEASLNAQPLEYIVLGIGGIELDKDSKQVKVEGELIRLTATEYGILQLLMENAGKVFSIEEIYEKVWNEQSFSPENTVSVHIRRIREKIEINPKEPRYLKVVWGIGYKIEKI